MSHATKTVPIESTGPTLQTLLPKSTEEEAVFLTVEGEVRFVVLPADEGDQEALAMRGNRRIMEFLDRCGERARTGLAGDHFARREHLGIGRMLNKERAQPPPGVREQRVIDEGDRGGGAFDVEEQTAAGEFNHA